MRLNSPYLDTRFVLLTLALAAMLALFIWPYQMRQAPVYQAVVVVDITRSMNVADYPHGDGNISRLAFVKQALREVLAGWPCQSRLGLAVFSERRSVLLFEPIEVCGGFNEIDAALANLDWRMAWAADSRINQGLHQTLEMLRPLATPVVFLTDGQEAPPLNPRYMKDLGQFKGKVRGLVVGVGGLVPSPIPKFNARGEADGFYRPEDVPHRSTFGESDLNPERIPGYNARNAPFGEVEVASTEHLSSLKEPYLIQLSQQAGLGYHRLTTAAALGEALRHPDFSQPLTTAVDVRWQAALLALLLSAACHAPQPRKPLRFWRRVDS